MHKHPEAVLKEEFSLQQSALAGLLAKKDIPVGPRSLEGTV